MGINYLFIAVIILFLYMIGRGYRKGFLRIVVTFIGTIFIIIAVKAASPYVSEYLLNNTNTYEKIQEKITEKFAEANTRYDNTIPENQPLTIDSYDLPDVLKTNLIINNTKEMYTSLLVSMFEEYVSAYLAQTAIKAMAFIILFIIMYAAFKIILIAVDVISKIPVIKGFNKSLGACLGLVEALLIVWIFFFAVVMFIGNDSGSTLLSMIASSKFLSFLFNSNILMAFIS